MSVSFRAAACAALLGALACPAYAVEYEVFVDVDSEDAIYELLASDQISETTFNALIDLWERGIDLDRATREELYQLPNLTYAEVDAILAYRDEVGVIDDPADLVAGGVLGADKLYALAGFLLLQADQRAAPVAGQLEVPVLWVVGDDRPPSSALRARVVGPQGLSGGVAVVMTRNRLGEVRHDPVRDALAAGPAATRVHVPKWHLEWRGDNVEVVAGTYRIGFAQRLTFDVTDRYTPSGFYADDAILRETDLTRGCKLSTGELMDTPCGGDRRFEYVGPDFRWREGLRGVAATLPRLEIGPGWLTVTGFTSHETHDLYQYETFDAAECDDPTRDDDPRCSAPPVLIRDEDDPLGPWAAASFQTLPAVFTESLVGARVAYAHGHRLHVGATGYAARVNWLARGADLDFQEWSRLPYGGPFGAVGIDGAWGTAWADVYAEVAQSFDSTPDGGGTGAVVRAVAATDDNEVELVLRWYGRDFANPHARPIAAADEEDGLRARDELGTRVRWTGDISETVRIRTEADVWVEPSTDTPKLVLAARGDHQPVRLLSYAAWASYRDKDLREGGPDECYETTDEEDLTGEPIPCAGKKLTFGSRVRFAPRRFSVTAQAQLAMLDDPRHDDMLRRDVSAYLLASVRLGEVTLRGRVRYLEEDIRDDTHLETTLWSYLEGVYRWGPARSLRLRYDHLVYEDQRESSLLRSPNPAHWFRAELDTRF